MIGLRSVLLRALLVLGVASCAQGFPDDPLALTPRPSTGSGIGQGGSASRAGAGAAGMSASGQAGRAAYTGESCRMGESAACTCSPEGTPGTKSCLFDRESPTMGTFSECDNCADPNAPEDDPGDVMSSGAGGSSGTAGGAGGRSGSTGGGSAGSGSPGASGSTGSSGSGGTSGGGSRGCMPACTNVCFPVGILPCCNALGRCGCTWAPGAYCL